LRGPAADRILLMARDALFRNRRATVIAAFFFVLRSRLTCRGLRLPAGVAGYRRRRALTFPDDMFH
jgi:hypothetical protein